VHFALNPLGFFCFLHNINLITQEVDNHNNDKRRADLPDESASLFSRLLSADILNIHTARIISTLAHVIPLLQINTLFALH
jgi:hypothetical protein